MEKKDKQEEKNRAVNIARYSAMGFQMLAIMGLAAFGGTRLDRLVNWKFPVFTFICTIIGVILALYYFIQDISRISKK